MESDSTGGEGERGNCYQGAALIADYLVGAGLPEEKIRIAHGMVSGQGRLRGIRFDHAWVEIAERWVMDGETWGTLHRARYYDLGSIRHEDVSRYTIAEAGHQMVSTEHYGPWV